MSCGEVAAKETQEFETLSNQSSPSPYQYKRLNHGPGKEIRLIRLYLGQGSDDIYCRLVHVDLIDEPVYESVSVSSVLHGCTRDTC